mgnify:CR=1 FL=1
MTNIGRSAISAELYGFARRLGWGPNTAADLAAEAAWLGLAEGRAHLSWLRGRLDALGKRPA